MQTALGAHVRRSETTPHLIQSELYHESKNSLVYIQAVAAFNVSVFTLCLRMRMSSKVVIGNT